MRADACTDDSTESKDFDWSGRFIKNVRFVDVEIKGQNHSDFLREITRTYTFSGGRDSGIFRRNEEWA